MINRLSLESNIVTSTGAQFNRLGSRDLGQQRATLAYSALQQSPVSNEQTRVPAITTNEMAVLIQSLTALIQLLERLVKPQGKLDEKAVVIKPVKPDVSKVDKHEDSNKLEVQTFPHISSKKVGEKPRDVWLEFNRNNRRTDNESSIKAAMMKYGQSPKNIYAHVKMVGSDYVITMRDGFKLKLSPLEIVQAQKTTNIWSPIDPEMAKDINFMVAASVKRVQLEDGLDSFTHALEFIEKSKDLGNGFKRLGLQANVRRTTWPELHVSRGTGFVLGPFGVQFAHDANVDCCSSRASLTKSYVKDGPILPYPCDALELI